MRPTEIPRPVLSKNPPIKTIDFLPCILGISGVRFLTYFCISGVRWCRAAFLRAIIYAHKGDLRMEREGRDRRGWGREQNSQGIFSNHFHP